MREKVVCNNCGIKWVKVISLGTDLELNDDLQNLCPNCNSNDYKLNTEDK